ncbi:MAG TPA: type II toxin-antitoxin system HicA family toxin [Candidatus Ozemobacteraceae bacterium]|nr:type II toxin-antitoxin system HicA family toxin [Candidatus Ozemobacteraceae bacterium]
MRGNEFIKRVRRLAKVRGWACEWYPDRGKGSHGVLTLGNARTIVRNPQDELKSGTFHGMCKQLGIRPDEL